MKQERTRKTRTNNSRARGGFSLLEAMVALGILAVGVLGMAAGQLAAMRLSGDSRGKMLASYLAEQQIENFQAMTPTAVTDLIAAAGYPNDPNNPIDPLPGDSDDSERLIFNRRWIIEPDTPSAGSIRITVEVDYVDSLGMTRTIRLQTIKAS